jgi:hypothetical protein
MVEMSGRIWNPQESGARAMVPARSLVLPTDSEAARGQTDVGVQKNTRKRGKTSNHWKSNEELAR